MGGFFSSPGRPKDEKRPLARPTAAVERGVVQTTMRAAGSCSGHFRLLGAEGFQALAQVGHPLGGQQGHSQTAPRLAALAQPMANVATGMPLGICTMLCSGPRPAGGGWPPARPAAGTSRLGGQHARQVGGAAPEVMMAFSPGRRRPRRQATCHRAYGCARPRGPRARRRTVQGSGRRLHGVQSLLEPGDHADLDVGFMAEGAGGRLSRPAAVGGTRFYFCASAGVGVSMGQNSAQNRSTLSP